MASQPPVAQVDAVAPDAQPVDHPQTAAAPLYPDDQPGQPDADPVQVDPAPQTDPDADTDPLATLAAQAEQPAIEAPASWAKDAKEQFTSLPREAQEIIAARETERDREVRRAQNSAATARQTAEREAVGQVRQIHEGLYQQYAQLAQTIQAQAPDIRLLQSADPQHHALYQEQDRQYRLAEAQHQQIAQAAEQSRQQAEQIAQQQEFQHRQEQYTAMVEAFPEWADPAGQATLTAQLEPIAAELGYSRELMAQADVGDFKALQTALSWKRDSDELRALKNKAKMIPVRAARQAPPVAPVRAPAATQAAKPVGSLASLYPDDVPK